MNDEDKALLESPLSLAEVQAMTLTAAVELAQRWLFRLPKAQPHLDAGAGVELLVQLKPVAGLQLLLVDSNGDRRVLADCIFDRASEH